MPKNLRVDTFPNPVGHFGAPWKPFFSARLVFYLCEEAYIPNFRPLVPFLHVKKFVVVGGGWVGVKTFSVKLYAQA